MNPVSPAIDVRAEALTTATAQRREPLHGLRQIVRLNWPFYAVATTVVVLTFSIAHRLPLGATLRMAVYSATALASFWLVSSLVSSWIIYDCSIVMTGEWIPRALGFRPATWINIHAGLDETTPLLRGLFGGSRGRVFDIFDPVEMTEPSIARARRLAPADLDSERVDFRHLPAETGSIEAAIVLLSVHELRTDAARAAHFTDLRRVLAPGGRVVVAEHLRDLPNFCAFGPGVLHFHSRRTWRRCFADTGFEVQQEFSVTPFIRVFILGGLA